MNISDKKYPVNSRQKEILDSISSFFSDIVLSQLGESLGEATQYYLDEVNRNSIDYSDVRDHSVKSQLELDSRMMLEARIKNNFEEYCRCSCLQIEASLEYFKDKKKEPFKNFLDQDDFYKNREEDYKKNVIKHFNKFSVYDFWFSSTSKQVRKPWDDEYNTIIHIFRIRDAASHRSLGHESFEDKLKKVVSPSSVTYTIEFYNRKNFFLVKKRTEELVKNVLSQFEML